MTVGAYILWQRVALSFAKVWCAKERAKQREELGSRSCLGRNPDAACVRYNNMCCRNGGCCEKMETFGNSGQAKYDVDWIIQPCSEWSRQFA